MGQRARLVVGDRAPGRTRRPAAFGDDHDTVSVTGDCIDYRAEWQSRVGLNQDPVGRRHRRRQPRGLSPISEAMRVGLAASTTTSGRSGPAGSAGSAPARAGKYDTRPALIGRRSA
jgi:hypothetical protein